MDYNQPVAVNLGEKADARTRFRAFFGHMDLRYYATPTCYVDIGAGSSSVIGLVRQISPEARGCVGTIGRHCECADGVTLLAGGEHRNDFPVNVDFGSAGILGQIGLEKLPRAPWSPVNIGNNVLMSRDAKVLSGAKVGNGAVLGANAVVTKDVEPFAIVARVPAETIRHRFDADTIAKLQAIRWWDFHPAYIAQNMAKIDELALSDGPHVYLPQRPRLIFTEQPNGVKLTGFADGDTERPIQEAPAKVLEYARQAHGPGPHYWLADPWA